jgi:hypothetical protein
VDIHQSSHKHGATDEDIGHAVEHAITVVDLEPDADPPTVLAIGPNVAGNLLEFIWLELDNDRVLVIHAMALRPLFYALLPNQEPRP